MVSSCTCCSITVFPNLLCTHRGSEPAADRNTATLWSNNGYFWVICVICCQLTVQLKHRLEEVVGDLALQQDSLRFTGSIPALSILLWFPLSVQTITALIQLFSLSWPCVCTRYRFVCSWFVWTGELSRFSPFLDTMTAVFGSGFPPQFPEKDKAAEDKWMSKTRERMQHFGDYQTHCSMKNTDTLSGNDYIYIYHTLSLA